MPLHREQMVHMEAHAAKLQTAISLNPSLTAQTTGVWTYLQESEAQLISLMDGGQPPVTAPGSIEMGPILYLLHQLPAVIVDPLKRLGMPPTAITPAMITAWETQLEGAGVVASDGTLFVTGTYAGLDPGWAYAAFEYVVYYLGIEKKAPFSKSPATVNLTGPSTLAIALTGDWGTGEWKDGSAPSCPSEFVMQQIQKASPNVVIHLGDVYYAGTQSGTLGLGPGEEASNFVDLWPNFPYSFTLNSNHEMYNGGNGYFNVALASEKFASQNKTSYFAIEFNDWLIFGLDSAYYDPSVLYMNGALVDQDQIGFIQSFDLTGKKVIVLTHHNGLTTDGQSQTGLWNNVVSALGQAPDYWYWGHVHDGIVYSSSSAAGSLTNARCTGHGALPFGNAYALNQSGSPIPEVLYYAHTPMPNPNVQQQNRVLNGYTVLTLTANSIVENFYDETGALAWPSQSMDAAGSH